MYHLKDSAPFMKMLPQHHRSTHLSTLEEQGAPLTSDQRQNVPSRNSDRIEIFRILDDERGANTYNTFNTFSRNHTERDNNTTHRAFDPYTILIRLTDAILIVHAMIVVISILITFAMVSLAIFRTVHGHVKDIQDTGIHLPLADLTLEDFHYISSIVTNKTQ